MMYSIFKGPIAAIIFLIITNSSSALGAPNNNLNKRSLEIKSLALLTYTKSLAIWQKELAELYQKMAKSSRKNRGAIDPRYLQVLRKKVREYHEVHYPRLQKVINIKPDLLSFKDMVEMTEDRTSVSKVVRLTPLLKARGRMQRGAIRFDKVKVNKYQINPNDELGSIYWAHFKNQFTAKIILLEAYTLGLSPFIETKAFRSILLRDLKSDTSSDTLEELWFVTMEELFKRDHLVKALSLYEEGLKLQEKTGELDQRLEEILEKSVVYKELNRRKNDYTFFRDMAKNMSFMAKRRWDTYKELGIGVFFEGSKIFGNVVGSFQSRHGFLYDWTKEQEESVANEFRPLDILMEKTPFRLTDKFIPGHFGHAAIWVGTEDELRALDVWEKLPELYRKSQEKYSYKGPSFQKAIREGHRIIEALRPGVQLNTFRHFLEIDDLAALRMRDCEENEEPLKSDKKDIDCLNNGIKSEYLLKAFEQVGKDYDFAFDVNTEQTIVCSELIYRTYLDIDFKTSLTVGLHNISPDQVAALADDEDDPFAPFLFYHQGKKVEEEGESLRSFMKNLMFP